jgi:hypothetical protein
MTCFTIDARNLRHSAGYIDMAMEGDPGSKGDLHFLSLCCLTHQVCGTVSVRADKGSHETFIVPFAGGTMRDNMTSG